MSISNESAVIEKCVNALDTLPAASQAKVIGYLQAHAQQSQIAEAQAKVDQQNADARAEQERQRKAIEAAASPSDEE